MQQALDEILKVKTPNSEIKILKGFLCQNLALIHKLKKDLVNSLKMSEQALESDPTNWKALLNRADLVSKFSKDASA